MKTTNNTGSRYEETRNESTAQIAKRIRADLKAASKGEGPLAGLKFRVRTHLFAGGSSIKITANGLEREAFALAAFGSTFRPVASPTVRAINGACERIAKAYGYDYSDSMTDYSNVRFYVTASTDVGTSSRTEWHALADRMDAGTDPERLGLEQVADPNHGTVWVKEIDRVAAEAEALIA